MGGKEWVVIKIGEVEEVFRKVAQLCCETVNG
jgi:hypothetical protein